MEKGNVVVEMVRGKSTVQEVYQSIPLNLLSQEVGPSKTDAVWIYGLTYGGGIVSGDSISVEFTHGDGCTAVLTTQASTKGYKSLGSKCSEQILESARIGSGALFTVIPDPVTCFSTARCSPKQVLRVVFDSSLVIVDWFTSGRHESGENWDFELYRSTNYIFAEGNQLVFLDTVLLEQANPANIAEHMHDYQVIAMVIICGPKLKLVQDQVQENVKRIMSRRLHVPSTSLGCHAKTNSDHCLTGPAFIASCSVFGPKEIGVVVRIASATTESVYRFIHHQLAGMEPLLGVSPYC